MKNETNHFDEAEVNRLVQKMFENAMIAIVLCVLLVGQAQLAADTGASIVTNEHYYLAALAAVTYGLFPTGLWVQHMITTILSGPEES
ncbi:hypothetical protein SAMN06269185_1056 [Natronoarchaeum philippinense]|uniref:Uncharacterized protein n=1 Tax=Natronoarchaeum philippinense TaxID=558529 RepID=A0A285N9M0_NATPI|nr:hypothetical protein [Natronoarchaeum philippinense]SNZ06120.1 hypothetical protein SAMN06269185_1056 [Natronoarchaeum philippinense]